MSRGEQNSAMYMNRKFGMQTLPWVARKFWRPWIFWQSWKVVKF